MSTLSTVGVPLILIGETSQSTIIFTKELLIGQALSLVVMNSDIIAGVVYEHMILGPVVVKM